MEEQQQKISYILSLDPSYVNMTEAQINNRIQMLDAERRIIRSEINDLTIKIGDLQSTIRENTLKIKRNKQYPLVVGTYCEALKEDEESAVVSSSSRSNYYLKNLGFPKRKDLNPGDLVAMHRDSNIIFQKIPRDFDSQVRSMELNSDISKESYESIGGLENQIEELNEAIVLPLLNPEKFEKLKIKPPKGVLLYGPPGTGKTLMARACAANSGANFLKLAGPQLVQMYIGEGARLVRDAFALAETKRPCIIFIDEIDAIGCKRSDSNRTGDREVQRTMLELLSQLDGFNETDVKIIAATNRVDILDPALLRSGRLDMKIEFPLPNLEGRKRILQIHSRKMNLKETVDFDEIAKSTADFNGAQLKAVCVEAGMIALRRDKSDIGQNEFLEAVREVMSVHKSKINYFI